MNLYGRNIENAFMGSEKHRVLIFGGKTYGTDLPGITSDLFDVDIIRFPGDRDEYEGLVDLSYYALVILDYSAFSIGFEDFPSGAYHEIVYNEQQEIFDKRVSQALDSGTCFCFLHYDENVPSEGGSFDDPGDMNMDDIKKCYHSQIGFRWLYRLNIRPFRSEFPNISSRLRRNEFKRYIEEWGASNLHFRPYAKGKFSDIIAEFGENRVLAFTLDFRRGKLVYIPCQRDPRPLILHETFKTLIDSLITYLTKTRVEAPEWSQYPIFDEEEKLSKEKADLEHILGEYQEKLDVFYSAKQLLFQSEYGLERALTEFLQKQCQIPTEREESYKEDFWLLDVDLPSKGQKIAICEIKSYSKGFRKSGLFNLYNHRESNDLPEGFPAVLFVNANLNAASWEQKNRPIDRQDYEEAASKHILIVRIEDLLFAWQALRENVINRSKLLDIFTNEVGWLKFKKDKSWQILK